jgi:ABC-type Fe3+-hydroxamate transport system substrate-binding protein
MELGDKIAIFDIDTPLPCIINHQYWIIRPDITMINNYYLLSFLLNSETKSTVNRDERNIKPVVAKGGKEFQHTKELEDFIKSVNGNVEAIQDYLTKINENTELVTITKAPEGTTRPDITLPDGTMLEVKINRFEFTSIHEDSLRELRIIRPHLDEQKKMEDVLKSLQYINEFKNTTKQLQDNINASVYNTSDTNSLIQELANIESVMKSLQDKYTHIETIIKN